MDLCEGFYTWHRHIYSYDWEYYSEKKLIKDAGVFEIIYPETNFLKLTKVPFIISIERVKL